MCRVFVFLVILCSLTSHSDGNEPWDGKPFSASAADILAAADKQPFPDDHDAEILFIEHSFRFDEQGRLTRRMRHVVRVATADAAHDWSTLEAVWSPWHEQRPKLKARVIQSNGEVLELDPKTIAESAIQQSNSALFSDRRMLQAPLPGIKAGVVIEREIAWTESKPFFAAGRKETLLLANYYPIRRARVTIEAPMGTPLRHVVRGLELHPKESRSDTRIQVVYESGPQEALNNVEPDQPPQTATFPYVAFSTGESWQGIAAQYSKLTEPQIDQEAVKNLVKDVLTGDESRAEAADKLLSKLRQFVRYTGLEFGESAIVPHKPNETLARRYGDCKDQSALLAAMLRAAGHHAHLALLSVGKREQLLEGLPGLNAFNHVIVYMPGKDPVWIDPTSPYTAVGTLPLVDQGKLALIVDPGTNGLKRTPRAEASANAQLRNFQINVTGNFRTQIKYTISERGATATSNRRWYSETARAEIEKSWMDAGKDWFAASALASLDYSDPLKLNTPFVTEAEFKDCQWGSVDSREFQIGLNATEVLDNLPWYLKLAETNQNDNVPTSIYQQTRRHPLNWPMRHVCQDTYRIVPPEGYVLKSLPESKSNRIGTAIFSRKFERAGEALIATFRFETGDGPLSPAHVTELRKVIAPFIKQADEEGQNVILQWEHSARKLFAAGKFKAGYARFRELAFRNPRDLENIESYVNVLLEGGFGTEARRVARQAVADMPDSAAAHGILGFALLHDEIGRVTRPGFDLPGCIKAYKKSLELDSTMEIPRWNLAIALEHDKHGNRYGRDADLQRAIGLYRTLLGKEGLPGDPATNLAYCLYFSNRIDELAKLIDEHSTLPPALQLAVVALRQGAAAATRKAETMSNDKQVQLRRLVEAGSVLNLGRHYALTRELYDAGSVVATNPRVMESLLRRLLRLKKIEQSRVETTKPVYPVQQVLGIVAGYGIEPKLIKPFTVNDALQSSELVAWEDHVVISRRQGIRSGAPVERRLDGVTVLEYDLDGSAEVGFRVKVSHANLFVAHFYVVPAHQAAQGDNDKAAFKLLLSGESRSELGAHTLSLLAEGKTDSARQWLKWAKSELSSGGLFNPFSGSPFARIWSNIDKEDPTALNVAAAMLAAGSSASQRAIEILEIAIDRDESAFRKLQMQRALYSAYLQQGDDDNLLALTSTLLDRYPTVAELRHYQVTAYYNLGRLDEAKAAATTWLEKHPENHRWALQLLAEIANDSHQYAEAHQYLLRLLKKRKLYSIDYNAVAWQSLFLRPLPETAALHASRACELTRSNSSACLHTLAAVHAELGQLNDARRVLQDAIAVRGIDRVVPHDWYVIGRMAEHAGLQQAARDAYSKVSTKSRNDSQRLAQIRLKAMSEEQLSTAP